MYPTLIINTFVGDNHRCCYEFEGSHARRLRIGRMRNADISIGDHGVSRLHAVIHIKAGKAFLRELGTIAGIIHNERWLRADSVELQHEDSVHIGNTELRISWKLPPEDATVVDVPPATLATRAVQVLNLARDRLGHEIADMSDATAVELERMLGHWRTHRSWTAVFGRKSRVDSRQEISVEKYDTQRLVHSLKREQRRNRGVATALALSMVGGMGVVLASTEPPTRRAAETLQALHAELTQEPPPQDSQQLSREATRLYVVRTGDTLGTISAAQLGHSKHWEALFEHNRDVVTDPSQLQVGMVLRLPAARAP